MSRLASRYYLAQSAKLIGEYWFEGISRIVLQESADLGSLGFEVDTSRVDSKDTPHTLSYYFFGSEREEAWIELYESPIYDGIPFPWSLTPVMILRFSKALAKVAVRHRLRQQGAVMTDYDEEILANRFARFFEASICNNPWFRFWRWVLRDLAKWHYWFGAAELRLGEMGRAEQKFYTAWDLDNTNQEAANWFWHLRNTTDK